MLAQLQHHGFQALWHPDLLAALLVVYVAYLLVVCLGYRYAVRARPPGPTRVLAFGLGLLAVYVAEGTPLHILAEQYLFSAHMLQHLLLALIMPPLLLLGLPGWLLRPLLRQPAVRRGAEILFHPLVGLLAFNLVYSLYHWPVFYQAGLRLPALHVLQHGLLISTALIMWWPVAAPVRALRLPEGLQILYLFGQGVAQLLVFAMITYADHVIYPWYAHAPRLLHLLSAREDQALAGFIMNVGGLAVFIPALLLAYRRWVRREVERFPLYPDPPGATEAASDR